MANYDGYGYNRMYGMTYGGSASNPHHVSAQQAGLRGVSSSPGGKQSIVPTYNGLCLPGTSVDLLHSGMPMVYPGRKKFSVCMHAVRCGSKPHSTLLR